MNGGGGNTAPSLYRLGREGVNNDENNYSRQ
nr:MAG TPA: hypothetical protein [Caudoviricetes sp.]